MCPFRSNMETLRKRGEVTDLIRALRDKDGRIREAAVDALGEIKDARAVEPLCAALRDTEIVIRRHAAKALNMIGQPG